MQSPPPALPLQALHHVSLVCSDERVSCAFYRDVLGFLEVRRPAAFKFDGRWLFRNDIGLHLIRGTPVQRPQEIDPESDHLSFQTDQILAVVEALKRFEIEFLTRTIRENENVISQIFFHDPDHNMIEVCNCHCLPVIVLTGGHPHDMKSEA